MALFFDNILILRAISLPAGRQAQLVNKIHNVRP